MGKQGQMVCGTILLKGFALGSNSEVTLPTLGNETTNLTTTGKVLT